MLGDIRYGLRQLIRDPGFSIVAAITLALGIGASDPITFLLLSAALVVVAFIACWLPARRASAVDPIVALRAE